MKKKRFRAKALFKGTINCPGLKAGATKNFYKSSGFGQNYSK